MEINDEIQIISDIEGIRIRPTMYLGNLLEDKLTMLLKEVLCIGIEESIKGKCNRINIEVGKDRIIKVKENGEGISMEKDEREISHAESFLTSLYGCREAKENKHLGRKICVIGIAVVNALSEHFAIENNWNGEKWFQQYNYGQKLNSFTFLGHTNDKGTEISFKLDTNILKANEIDVNELKSYFHSLELDVCSLKVQYKDLVTESRQTIFSSSF